MMYIDVDDTLGPKRVALKIITFIEVSSFIYAFTTRVDDHEYRSDTINQTSKPGSTSG